MINTKELEHCINDIWKKYDEAIKSGDLEKAEYCKSIAFDLIERLPQNQINLGLDKNGVRVLQ